MLNGGVYPSEDGTWRVCCWLGGIRTEAEAKNVSEWLAKLLQANMSQQPPPPRPEPSVPFAKS